MSLLYHSPKTEPHRLSEETVDDEIVSYAAQVTTSTLIWSYLRSLAFVSSWILTLIFALLWLSTSRPYTTDCKDCENHTFEKGWSTDFGPVTSSLFVTQVNYTGGPIFGPRGDFYVPNPGAIEYKGSGVDIDQAWDNLIWGRYFLISEEEARGVRGSRYKDLYNEEMKGYEIGLDMFHTLHCLNNLRKLLYPDYYHQVEDPQARIHDQHCIEQLRQQVMCAGDITPIPVRFSKAVNKSYVMSDVTHTCRDFKAIQDWMLERFTSQPKHVQQMLINQ